MTTREHLIRQTNRISAFFEAMPDKTEGMDNIVTHITRFWAPSLRQHLLGFLEEHPDGRAGDLELSPLALTALNTQRDRWVPRTTD